MRGSRVEGTEVPDLNLNNHKAIGFLSNTGLDTLKNCKDNNSAFNVGQSSPCQQNTIEVVCSLAG